MKLYNRKLQRNVERQIHFGLGESCQTVCGLTLFSRHVMVSVFGDSDGALITSDMSRVTCRRCLRTNDLRLRKLLAIEASSPGIFDHPPLCGENWILGHALDVTQDIFNKQVLEVDTARGKVRLSVTMSSKDRKGILKGLRDEQD